MNEQYILKQQRSRHWLCRLIWQARSSLTVTYRRHQVFDLPEVRYQVTEHRLYAGVCICCGQRQVAQLPRDVPQGQMGAGLISWITVMNGACRLSVRQIQSLLEEQWQLTFSSGAVSEATEPVSRWLQPLYAQVGDAVRASPLIHADETTHYRKAERRWLWVLCSPQVVYFLTHTSRGKAAADALLGSCSGVLVTDQHGGYNNYPKERRQLCWAHLIRKFKKMDNATVMQVSWVNVCCGWDV